MTWAPGGRGSGPRPGSGGWWAGVRGGSVLERIRGSFFGLPRTVRWLVVLQIGLYLVLVAAGSGSLSTLVHQYLAVGPGQLGRGRLWTLLSYIPFHAAPDAFGMLFDVLILWSFGKLFGARWREGHFLFFYLAGGVAGGGLHAAAALVFPERFGMALLGASGGSFALLAAFWLIFGEQPVSMFGSSPFRGRWVFIALLGLETLFFFSGANPHFAVQLGGVAAGWLLVTGRWRPGKLRAWLSDLSFRIRVGRRRREKERFRVMCAISSLQPESLVGI